MVLTLTYLFVHKTAHREIVYFVKLDTYLFQCGSECLWALNTLGKIFTENLMERQNVTAFRQVILITVAFINAETCQRD